MADDALPMEWAFLAPLLDEFYSLQFPWEDLLRATDEPVSLNVTISTLELMRDPDGYEGVSTYTALLMAVVTRALRFSPQVREALWPRHPHAPFEAELSFVNLDYPPYPFHLFDEWKAAVRHRFLHSPPDSHPDNAIAADAMRQLELRVPGASVREMPMLITARSFNVDGLRELVDLLESLLHDSPWIKLRSSMDTDHTKHPSVFTVHELQLTLENLDQPTVDQLHRIQSLGFSITRLKLVEADATTPAFRAGLATLLTPAGALSHLEIVPVSGIATFEITVMLSELLDQASSTKRCSVVMYWMYHKDRAVVARVLPKISQCLQPVVRSLCLHLPTGTEDAQQLVPLHQLIDDTWADPGEREHVRVTIAAIDQIAHRRQQATASSDDQSLRVESMSEMCFPTFYAEYVLVSPWLTTLEMRVWFHKYFFTRSDIASILRSLPRLKTLLLEQTEITDMSVFLEAYDDPACAQLEVLAITSGGTRLFVPFLETLMDTKSVAATKLRELRMVYDPRYSFASRFLDAVVRLLTSANETLWLLRLYVPKRSRRELRPMCDDLRACYGRPVERLRHRAALASVFQRLVPHFVVAPVVAKVWGFADAGRHREVFFEVWGDLMFAEQSCLEPELTNEPRWDTW